MPRAGIALGSNLGDRMANLCEAMRLIGEIADKTSPFLKAAIYQTEPLHCPPDSPNFSTLVIVFASSVGRPRPIFEFLLSHRRAGKHSGCPNGT